VPFVRALSKSELEPGHGKCVVLQGRKIALFNLDGRFYALDDTCSHAEASLATGELRVEGCRCTVECPEHGSQFDLQTGQALTLPATMPVKRYAVRENGEDLEVEL
jgi:3-phenylpropionate/trans-cinnamate dioxygenase ferredoxin subunit